MEVDTPTTMEDFPLCEEFPLNGVSIRSLPDPMGRCAFAQTSFDIGTPVLSESCTMHWRSDVVKDEPGLVSVSNAIRSNLSKLSKGAEDLANESMVSLCYAFCSLNEEQRQKVTTLVPDSVLSKPAYRILRYLLTLLSRESYAGPYAKLFNSATVEDRMKACIAAKTHAHYFDSGEDGHSAIYWKAAMLAHSCSPNVAYSCHNGNITYRAVKPIAKGDMLLCSYLSNDVDYRPTHLRRQTLMKEKDFWCQCPRCRSVDLCRAFTCSSKGKKKCKGYVVPTPIPGSSPPAHTWSCEACGGETDPSALPLKMEKELEAKILPGEFGTQDDALKLQKLVASCLGQRHWLVTEIDDLLQRAFGETAKDLESSPSPPPSKVLSNLRSKACDHGLAFLSWFKEVVSGFVPCTNRALWVGADLRLCGRSREAVELYKEYLSYMVCVYGERDRDVADAIRFMKKKKAGFQFPVSSKSEQNPPRKAVERKAVEPNPTSPEKKESLPIPKSSMASSIYDMSDHIHEGVSSLSKAVPEARTNATVRRLVCRIKGSGVVGNNGKTEDDYIIVCSGCSKSAIVSRSDEGVEVTKVDGSPSGFKICSRCRCSFYCSIECQQGHWSEHRISCKPYASHVYSVSG